MESGIAEDILFEDEDGNDITEDFGAFSSASFEIQDENRAERSIGSGGKPVNISDGPVENQASLTCKPETLEVLKIMGSFDSENGEITFEENLPEHETLQGQFTSDHSFKFSDFKVGGFTLEAGIDESVTIEFDPIHAKTGEILDEETPEFNQDCNPLNWTDSTLKIDGEEFGVIESIAGNTLDRDISPEHGIGSGREPEAVVEGNFSINPDFVVKVEDAEPWEKMLDDTSYPLTIQDSKDPIDEISVDFGDSNGEIVIEEGKVVIDPFDMEEDKETRTVTVDITGKNIKVRNL